MKFLSMNHLYAVLLTVFVVAFLKDIRPVDVLLVYGVMLANTRALLLEGNEK